MENTVNTDLMRKIEKTKDRVLEVKLERNMFLGEYKERVLVALTFDEVMEKGIYYEVEKALENIEAKKLLISREIDFKFIKKYIEIAKSKNKPYKMIDSLLNVGDIGLVVVSDDAISNPLENPIVISKKENFKEHKLNEIYYMAMGQKICKFHYEIIKKELPEYEKNYSEIGFMDSLFGTTCPICKKLGGKKRG